MAQTVLLTERLVLRPPRLTDAEALFGFLGDSTAMQFTQVRESLRDCRRYIALHERQRRNVGCAPWTVLTKADNTIVGYGGLYDDPFDPGWGVELAYFFAPDEWGKGYATELGRASLHFVAAQRLRSEIVSFAHLENTPSQNVLTKIGFQFERFVPEMDRNLYKWKAPSQPPPP